MKKILSFLAMSAIVLGMASCGGNDGNEPEPEVIKAPSGYVDLGLPSKTLWYSNATSYNFLSFPTYVEELNKKKKNAATKYVDIPTKEDWEELHTYCTWEWMYPFTIQGINHERAYIVKGKNGNSIILPALGKRSTTGQKVSDGKGYYWMQHTNHDIETAVQFGEESNSFQFYGEADGWCLTVCWVFKQP